MAPLLKGGEYLTIRKVPASSLQKGDLVLFASHGSLILHRIIRKSCADNGTAVFQTQGDARQSADGPVHQDKVLGKVLKIEKTLPGGRLKQMDMEAASWKVLNASMVMIIPIRMLMRHALSGFFIHVPALTHKFIRMVFLPQSRKLSEVGNPSENQERFRTSRSGKPGARARGPLGRTRNRDEGHHG
jgi:signal peptidase I